LNWALTGIAIANAEHAAKTATDNFTFIVKPPIQSIWICATPPTVPVKHNHNTGPISSPHKTRFSGDLLSYRPPLSLEKFASFSPP
jgi:hypothetical protein